MQSQAHTSNQLSAPKREELIESRERVKLEGRPDAEEETLSQPSTIHSLSHIEDHTSPEKTPTSTELLQKGWHKTTDTIAQGVEGIKNLLTTSEDKLNQAKESISKEASNLQGDIKQKTNEVKGKMTEKFGDEIQPEKDLDAEVKEQIKEVNEEIKHQPHGEEEIVEAQGQAKLGQKDLSSKKTSEMKDKFGSQMENLKESSKGLMNEASQQFNQAKGKINEKFQEQVQSGKDLGSKIKDQSKEASQEIQKQSGGIEKLSQPESQSNYRYERREESKGQRDAGDKDLKDLSKEILDNALNKIDEVKEKTNKGAEQFKQEAQESSNKSTQTFSEKKSESTFESKQEKSEVEVKEGNQPLTKDTKEEILDLAQQITDKIQELKAGSQLSSERKSQTSTQQQQSHFQSQNQSQSQIQGKSQPEESGEHHHLSTESPSFRPTQESHELIEKVKEGLEEQVPLTEIVEEVEHEKQSSSQSQARQPALDKIQQGFQEASSKLSGKFDEMKDKFNAPKQVEKSEFNQEKRFEGQTKPQETFQSQPQERQPALDKIQQGFQEASSKLSGKLNEVKDKFDAPKQEKSEFSQEKSFEGQTKPQETFQSQPQERQPALDKIQQGFQGASSKLSGKFDEMKDKINAPKQEEKGEGEQKSFQSQPQPQEKSLKTEDLKQDAQNASEESSDKTQDDKKAPEQERQPLVDKVLGRIHAVNDNFHQSVESVKNAFKIEERTDERQPLLDVVTERINDMSSKISQGIEAVKGRAKPSHEEDFSQQKEESAELTKEGGQSLKQKISGGFQNISNTISQNMENMKDRFRSGKEGQDQGTEKFHKVDDGFSETVKEYKEEKRLEELGGQELISGNPFEPLSGGEALEKQTYFEKLKSKFRKEKPEDDEEDQIKDIDTSALTPEEAQTLKQKIGQSIEGLKGKFGFGKEKLQETSEQSTENKPSEKESQTLKDKANEHFIGLSKKFSQNLKDTKDKLSSTKQETKEEKPEQFSQEKSLEQGSEASKQESQSLKQKISGGFQNVSGKISQNIEGLKGKFRSEKEETKGGETEQFSEEKPLEQGLESPKHESQSLKQKISGGFQNISGKISQNVDTLKGKFKSGKQDEEQEAEALDEPAEPLKEESESIETSKQPLKEKVSGSLQGISSQISQKVGDLKSKFTSGKEKLEEIQERDPKDDGKFHKVKEGTTETVSELKEEERVEPLLSNNPFEPLETRKTNLTQPLDNNEIVGGELKELTAGEGPSFKVEEGSGENLEENAPNKSLLQKVKASVSGASASISNQLNLTKDKVLSTFSHKNKENTEDKSASQNENA